MRRRWTALAYVALAAAGQVDSQVRPQPGAGDARIQSIDYRPDQVVLIQAAAGYQVTVELAPDEQVQSIALGDNVAWQVTANRAGNHLFVKPVQLGAATNMTVVTSVRLYAFDLEPVATPTSTMPYAVRFRYPSTASMPPEPVVASSIGKTGSYRLSGARALRPSRIADDGVRTFIDWPADASLPAVFTLDDQGRETLVNGNMRGGVYVIDDMPRRLLFRIDKQIARADRLQPRRHK